MGVGFGIESMHGIMRDVENNIGMTGLKNPIGNLRSKRFRSVSEQRTKKEGQRPREKWREWKSEEGVGKKGRFLPPLPLPPPARPSFIF